MLGNCRLCHPERSRRAATNKGVVRCFDRAQHDKRWLAHLNLVDVSAKKSKVQQQYSTALSLAIKQ